MAIDTVQNFLSAIGDSADRLIANDMDTGILRPWRGADGRNYVLRTYPNGEQRVLVTNAPASLPYDTWKLFDDTVIDTIQQRLQLVGDIRGAGQVYNLPNGMAQTVLQYQTRGDITRATISMSPARRSEGDRPMDDIAFFPLPIIHKDFDYDARDIAISTRGGQPLDKDTAAMAAFKVAEEIEMLAAGTTGTFSFGGGTIYGLINFPQRATKTDMPVPDGTNGNAVLNAILTLRQMLINNRHFGPYRMYVNSQWSSVLDSDFNTAKGDLTLRQRISAVSDIQDIVTLDHLPTTHWHCVLVEMKSTNVRAVIGMDVQTAQWDSMGGFMKHFKVMAMMYLQYRPDTAGNSGIAHGTTVAA